MTPVREGMVVVLDSFGFDAPSTKAAKKLLADLGVGGKSLVVASEGDENTWLSFRNLPGVHLITPGELNPYDVLVADWLVFTSETLPTNEEASS